MLIYLDQAHISALDDLLRHEPDAFAEFIAFWLEHECELVVSRAHLHEISQTADPLDMERRVNLLRYFPIRSSPLDENVDWVVIREIREQTLSRLRNGDVSAPSAYARLREELYQSVEHESLERFVHRARPGLLDDLRDREQLAKFDNRRLALQKRYTKETGKRKVKWDPEAWRLLPFVQSQAPSVTGDMVGDRWNAEVKGRAQECWRRARGQRQAYICMYDLEGLPFLNRAPLEDLSRLGFFRALGRHWLAGYCRRAGFDPRAVEDALDQFDPYHAPAISTSLAVERGRKLHDRKFEAGDYMDVDHVLWAAHTDLAFVDKRTHGFIAQARKTTSASRLLSPHLTVRFERGPMLEDVKTHVSAVAKTH